MENNTSVTDYFKHDVVMTSADVASDREFLIKNMEEHGGVGSANGHHNDTTPTADAYWRQSILIPITAIAQ